MADEVSRDTAKFYEAFSHPIRKRIVDLIEKNGRIGFRDLKKELKVSVGTLYYHLDALGDLVGQDAERKYILTDKGRLAIKMFASSEESLEAFGSEKKPSSLPLISRLGAVILPRQLFTYVSSAPRKHIVEALAVIAFGSWVLAEAKLEPILLFFNSRTTAAPYFIIIQFWVTWIIVYALSEALSYFIYRRKEEHLGLLSGTAFSLIPLIFYAFLWFLVKSMSPDLLLNTILWWGLLLVCQIWSVGLLSIAISVSKGLRIDKAAVISFLIQYLNIAYVLLFVMRFII